MALLDVVEMRKDMPRLGRGLPLRVVHTEPATNFFEVQKTVMLLRCVPGALRFERLILLEGTTMSHVDDGRRAAMTRPEECCYGRFHFSLVHCLHVRFHDVDDSSSLSEEWTDP
jgi:hypothetical protein